jgi:hypothetical protein
MDILLDTATHDIVLQGRDLGTVTGNPLIAQRLKQNLLTQLGEWFLDASIGLPWFDDIFQKGTSLGRMRQYLIREIVNTNGVQKLNSLDLSVNNATRRLTVAFVVNDNLSINLNEVF